jgi:hypothetical protein
VPAHLQGRLGELRQRLAVDEHDVTDGEDALLPHDPQIGAGQDAAAARLGRSQPLTASWAATPAAYTVMWLASAVPSASRTAPGVISPMPVPSRISMPRLTSWRRV